MGRIPPDDMDSPQAFRAGAMRRGYGFHRPVVVAFCPAGREGIRHVYAHAPGDGLGFRGLAAGVPAGEGLPTSPLVRNGDRPGGVAAGLPGGRPASGPPDRRRPRTGPGGGSVMVARMLFAALLGALIGGAELVGRYQDKPASAVFSPSGLLYIAVNASASTAALIAAEAMGWGFALPDGAPAV